MLPIEQAIKTKPREFVANLNRVINGEYAVMSLHIDDLCALINASQEQKMQAATVTLAAKPQPYKQIIMDVALKYQIKFMNEEYPDE